MKKRDNMTNIANEIQETASEMQSFQNFFVQLYHRLFFIILYILMVENNTGSLAEGIRSADPGTPLYKK